MVHHLHPGQVTPFRFAGNFFECFKAELLVKGYGIWVCENIKALLSVSGLSQYMSQELSPIALANVIGADPAVFYLTAIVRVSNDNGEAYDFIMASDFPGIIFCNQPWGNGQIRFPDLQPFSGVTPIAFSLECDMTQGLMIC